MMCQSLDELKEYAKKSTGSSKRIAVVAPFGSTDNGLKAERVFFSYVKTAGDQKSKGTLPGFLYQLGSAAVKHSASCQVAESKATADSSVIVQALWPSSDIAPDKWTKIQAGDLLCFRKMIEEVLDFKLCSQVVDVFKLGRVADDTATALVRVRSASFESFMRSSGMASSLFFNPVGDKRTLYKVLWLRREEATSRSEAAEFVEKDSKSNEAFGMVWKRDAYGIRYLPEHCEAHKRSLGRPAGSLWSVAGLPYDASDEVLVELLSTLSWKFDVIPGSRRTKQGSAAWRVRADDEPPVTSLPARWLHYHFIIRISPVVTKSQGRILEWKSSSTRAASLQPTSWSQVNRLPPWTDQRNPWAEAGNARPSADNAASSRGRSTPASKRARDAETPVSKQKRQVSFERQAVAGGDADVDVLQQQDPWMPKTSFQISDSFDMEDDDHMRPEIAAMEGHMEQQALETHHRLGQLEAMVAEMHNAMGQITAFAHAQAQAQAAQAQAQAQAQYMQSGQQVVGEAPNLDGGAPPPGLSGPPMQADS
eukprot:4506792-Amphidinium_carterae.1